MSRGSFDSKAATFTLLWAGLQGGLRQASFLARRRLVIQQLCVPPAVERSLANIKSCLAVAGLGAGVRGRATYLTYRRLCT
jgi:hypothetical protein